MWTLKISKGKDNAWGGGQKSTNRERVAQAEGIEEKGHNQKNGKLGAVHGIGRGEHEFQVIPDMFVKEMEEEGMSKE
jgi:hypothetical protein